MKKYLLVISLLVIALTSCTTFTRFYTRAKVEKGQGAGYDKLFNAAMQILNAQNYSIIKSQRSEGIIVATKVREVVIVMNENADGIYFSINSGYDVSDKYTKAYDPCPQLKDDIILLYRKFSGDVVPDPITKYLDSESAEIKEQIK